MRTGRQAPPNSREQSPVVDLSDFPWAGGIDADGAASFDFGAFPWAGGSGYGEASADVQRLEEMAETWRDADGDVEMGDE